MIYLNDIIFDNSLFITAITNCHKRVSLFYFLYYRYINVAIFYSLMYIEYHYNKLFNGATFKCCTCLSIGFLMQRALTVSEHIFPIELGCLASFRSGNLMSLVFGSKSFNFLEAINMLFGAIDSIDIRALTVS